MSSLPLSLSLYINVMWEVCRQFHFNFVLFNFRSQLYFCLMRFILGLIS